MINSKKELKVEKLKENRSSQREWLTIDHGSDDSVIFKENVIANRSTDEVELGFQNSYGL
jgi:hypothetical protein